MELDTDEVGLVILNPVTGMTVFLPYDKVCGLRLEYSPAPDHPEKPKAIQFVLSPPQARALAEMLLDMAGKSKRTAKRHGLLTA